MTNFVFVYFKKGKFRCLNLEQAKNQEKELIENGWKHTATLNPEIWMEYFLNSKKEEQEEEIIMLMV